MGDVGLGDVFHSGTAFFSQEIDLSLCFNHRLQCRGESLEGVFHGCDILDRRHGSGELRDVVGEVPNLMLVCAEVLVNLEGKLAYPTDNVVQAL